MLMPSRLVLITFIISRGVVREWMLQDLSNLVLATQAKMLSSQYFVTSIISKSVLTLVFLNSLPHSTAFSPTGMNVNVI